MLQLFSMLIKDKADLSEVLQVKKWVLGKSLAFMTHTLQKSDFLIIELVFLWHIFQLKYLKTERNPYKIN